MKAPSWVLSAVSTVLASRVVKASDIGNYPIEVVNRNSLTPKINHGFFGTHKVSPANKTIDIVRLDKSCTNVAIANTRQKVRQVFRAELEQKGVLQVLRTYFEAKKTHVRAAQQYFRDRFLLIYNIAPGELVKFPHDLLANDETDSALAVRYSEVRRSVEGSGATPSAPYQAEGIPTA